MSQRVTGRLPAMKPRAIRFTEAQWEFLKKRAIETGVRDAVIYLRQMVELEMKNTAQKVGA